MFEIRVEDTFSISGRGFVLVGVVAKGPIAVGNRCVLRTPHREVGGSVAAIELRSKSVTSAQEGETVGVLCRGIAPTDVSDCYSGNGEQSRPLDVYLVSAPERPKAWWEFWRA